MKEQIFIEKNHNGSFTISTFKTKTTYYGCGKTEAVRKFKHQLSEEKQRDKKQRSVLK